MASQKQTASDRPNIVYILGDDHRGEILGCAAHPVVETPNIDRLAVDGVRFSNFFCTSPVCTPSRCCHYLGQWERTHGVNFNSNSSVAPRAWQKSFPMLLKQQGYFTGWVGKNHVPAGNGGYDSGYLEREFDYWYGNHNHSGFYPKEQPRGRIYRNAAADTQVEVFLEGALNFLEPQRAFIESAQPVLPRRPEDRPFCLCITFNLPHAHGTSTMELRPTDDEIYKSLYRDRFRDIPLPPTYISAWALDTPRLPPHVYDGVQIPSYDYVRTPMALKERRIREYQTITGMDRMLGVLRETLDRLGLAGNTIIVFSTDHGIHHGEHGLGGKNFLYEEDLRIPCVLYDPRRPAEQRGRVIDEMVLVPDLAPTVLELMGLDSPSSMQGNSVVPLIRGEDVAWRQDFFAEALMDIQNYPRSECLRTTEWKYIRYFRRTEDPRARGLYRGTLDNYIECLSSTIEGEQPVYEELFHLAEDPIEEQNLAGDRTAGGILDGMRERIVTRARDVTLRERPLTLPLDG